MKNTENKIPNGSVLSWSVPPSELKGFEKFFNILQNYFTERPETHASIIVQKLSEYGDDVWLDFEASNTVRFTLYSQNKNSVIFDILAPDNIKFDTIKMLRNLHFGKIYDIFQTIFFLFMWAFKKIGINTRKWKNPFALYGLICSELVYLYLWNISLHMGWDDLMDYLSKWNSNNFHAGDVRVVLDWMIKRGYARLIFIDNVWIHYPATQDLDNE